MSSTATKRPLAEAQHDAVEFINAIPLAYFDRIEIAGSIRRLRPTVGDVEIVVIPVGDLLHRWLDEQTAGSDLFGAEPEFRRAIYSNGTQRWGDRYRGVEWRGFKYELFFATPENFGPILAIRTGPSAFSEMMVTKLHATRLRMRDGYLRYQDGSIYPCPTEEDFFERCGMDWIAPEDRDAYMDCGHSRTEATT